MTIDEAIEHEEWATANSGGTVSEEHAQYAAWLRLARDVMKEQGERDGRRQD